MLKTVGEGWTLLTSFVLVGVVGTMLFLFIKKGLSSLIFVLGK